MALALIGIAWNVFRTIKYHLFTDPYDPIVHAVTIAGFLIVSFSKEKNEDEFLDHLRLRSFLLSVLFTSLYVIVFNIVWFLLKLKGTTGASTSLAFLQAFYLGYFYYLRKKYKFL